MLYFQGKSGVQLPNQLSDFHQTLYEHHATKHH